MDLTPVLIVATIFYFIYAIWDRMATRKERVKLLESIATMDPETLAAFKNLNPSWEVMVKKDPKGILRPACLLIGLGLGLLVVWMGLTYWLPYNGADCFDGTYGFINSFLMLATPLFFGGLGLLVAYLVERRQK